MVKILKVVLISVLTMFGFNGCATGELDRQIVTSNTGSSFNRPIKENVYYKSATVRHSGIGDYSASEMDLKIQQLKSMGKDTSWYDGHFSKVENMKKSCLTTSNTWINQQNRIKMTFIDDTTNQVYENWFNAYELREESPNMQKLCQQRYATIYKKRDELETRILVPLFEHAAKCEKYPYLKECIR